MATPEVNKPRSLPPYPEMILKAIEALNEENGSNKTTISKYIESTYGGLPQGHKALLNVHLAKMRDSGKLVFWKNNYTIRDPNTPPRRGRGRPRKPKDPLSPGTIVAPSRPRGRPPKDPNELPRPPKAKTSGGSGRPRGRPRKMARPSGGFDGSPPPMVVGGSPSGRGRGRPPKMKGPLAEISVDQ
ncbi:HMG-Y-related protein A [Arachis duranensis]|uniref:HMG-Y-related protein A n=1 Tax=Arachis duranensis TaxID=130453 RepID=A0A6P4CUX8_ARADU|nr:HMG-Y-related protein A [Arachis duranensis]